MIHDTICAGAGPAEVDLLLYKDGNPSSVRDMLLFEDFGCLADPKTFGEEEGSDQDTSYDYDVLGAEGPLPPPPNDIQTRKKTLLTHSLWHDDKTGFIFVRTIFCPKSKMFTFSQAHSHASTNATRRHEYFRVLSTVCRN